MEECSTLRNKIEELIRASHLKKYVKVEQAKKGPPHGRSLNRLPRQDDCRYGNRPPDQPWTEQSTTLSIPCETIYGPISQTTDEISNENNYINSKSDNYCLDYN